MSDFAGEGFKPFPNTHSDAQEVAKVVEWSDEHLDYKINEYGEFLQRTDIMERARRVGNFVLDRMLFDLACRDGLYDPIVPKIEDELCEEAA